jgi:hypothetical protein
MCAILGTAVSLLILAACATTLPDATSTPVATVASTPSPTQHGATLLADTCGAASAVLSTIYNADVGLYAAGAGLYGSTMTAEEWAEQVDGARTAMAVLATADNGEAAPAIADLDAAVRSIPSASTADYTATDATADASRAVNVVCTANNTEIVISAKYGG